MIMEIDRNDSPANAGPTNRRRREFLTTAAVGSVAAAALTTAGATAAAASATPFPAMHSATVPSSVPANGLGIATDDIDISRLPRVKQKMVAPPFLPEHSQIAEGGPKIVEVTLTVEEKKILVDGDNDVSIWAMTFNGSVPGPMIVCHQGDYVELTLINPSTNQLTHNIDLHAATGGLGGGQLTLVNPGEKVTMLFRANYAGVHVYHCAPGGLMIPYHVTHGMNGAIMVLPRDGLKDGDGTPLPYDRAYYIGEQDFYVSRKKDGDFYQYNEILEDYPDSLETMATLMPSHVVFNGAVESLTGDNAMKAKVGERVLIIHSQANRDTRPHLIGGHGDYVWETGSFADAPAHGLETWFIRGGSAGAALYTFQQPGVYVYLNHDLITAFELGALAQFKVEGKWNDKLMTVTRKVSAV